MKPFATYICLFLLLAGCTKEKKTTREYNKYTFVLSARTNMPEVVLIFTDKNGKLINAELNPPGIDYVYGKVHSGDMIYVDAVVYDPSQSGYISCHILQNNISVFAHESKYDSALQVTRNRFVYYIP